MKAPKEPTVREKIHSAYNQLARIAESDRLFDECYEAALDSERKHRAMGRRVCGATYRLPASVAAEYFVCKWTSEHVAKPHSWECASIRIDAQRGYQLGERLRSGLIRGFGAGSPTEAEAAKNCRAVLRSVRKLIAEIDYAKDIARHD
jgi:hypothetical protein